MEDFKKQAYNLKLSLVELAKFLHEDQIHIEVIELENKISQINDDYEKTGKLEKEITLIQKPLEMYKAIKKRLLVIDDFIDLLNEAYDSEIEKEIVLEFNFIENEMKELELLLMFQDKNDKLDCFLEIQTGVGGVDSQDWSSILMRMYLMYCQKKGFESKILYQDDGEQAGIKSVIISIKGSYSYGLLKNETGVHRLVRISPFNSNGKRQTSFSNILVLPQIDDSIDLKIDEKDLRIDVYRSSGAGGQSVNKTESAVRITHIPSGIVVAIQDEKSQIQNRKKAMSVLRARLYEVERKKKEEEKNKQINKTDIGWGHQIRNYCFHPYRLIKDVRTNFETSNIDKILDGDLDDIIKSLIINKNNKL